jgi:hypothetical protein
VRVRPCDGAAARRGRSHQFCALQLCGGDAPLQRGGALAAAYCAGRPHLRPRLHLARQCALVAARGCLPHQGASLNTCLSLVTFIRILTLYPIIGKPPYLASFHPSLCPPGWAKGACLRATTVSRSAAVQRGPSRSAAPAAALGASCGARSRCRTPLRHERSSRGSDAPPAQLTTCVTGGWVGVQARATLGAWPRETERVVSPPPQKTDSAKCYGLGFAQTTLTTTRAGGVVGARTCSSRVRRTHQAYRWDMCSC